MTDNPRLSARKRLLHAASGVAVVLYGIVGFSGSANADTRTRRVAPFSETYHVDETYTVDESYTYKAAEKYTVTESYEVTEQYTYTVTVQKTREVTRLSGTKRVRVAPYSEIVTKRVRVKTGETTGSRAQQILHQLADSKILQRSNMRAGGRSVWIAPDVIDAVDTIHAAARRRAISADGGSPNSSTQSSEASASRRRAGRSAACSPPAECGPTSSS